MIRTDLRHDPWAAAGARGETAWVGGQTWKGTYDCHGVQLEIDGPQCRAEYALKSIIVGGVQRIADLTQNEGDLRARVFVEKFNERPVDVQFRGDGGVVHQITLEI